MKKRFLIAILTAISSISHTTMAQQINIISVSEKRDCHNFYTMMKEAFPLAYNDPAAPRFIFFDNNKNFIFGVGGYVQLTGVYDFNGVENYNFFTTSAIAMKGHQGGASYGMTIGQSRLFFKLIGNTDVGRLVSYLEMEFQGPQNTPKLQQAFVQFKGFTLGQTWSTFGDMTAVPTTIDEEGPSSGIEIRQPMIRYTCRFHEHWESSLALEYAQASYSTGEYAKTIRQKIPDIPLNIRYTTSNKSHFQLGAILRNISYQNQVTDKDKIHTCWGIMGSGLLNLSSATSLMFQTEYGKGIANYIQDISGMGYDLIPISNDGELKAPGMWGLFAACQHNWTSDLYSTLTYSYARLEECGNLNKDTYKYAQYAAINLLWNFSEYGTTGLEYVFGRRNDFNHDYGNASRINAMIQYNF